MPRDPDDEAEERRDYELGRGLTQSDRDYFADRALGRELDQRYGRDA